MLTLPCSSQTFEDVFPTESHCLDYLRKLSWGTYEYLCPRCSCSLGYAIENRNVIQCANRRCRYQASLTSGTIFHSTKLCIRSWFKAIVHYCENRDVSVRNFAQLTELPYKTAWLILTKLKIAYDQCWEEESAITPNQAEEYDSKADLEADPETDPEAEPEFENVFEPVTGTDQSFVKNIHEDGTEEITVYFDHVEEMDFRYDGGRIRYVQRRKPKRNIAAKFYFVVFCCLAVPPLAVIRYILSQRDPLERYTYPSPRINYLH